ncbi:MAG: hypothetical protein EOP50_03310, partial [Sphingobacteriales bacterium]
MSKYITDLFTPFAVLVLAALLLAVNPRPAQAQSTQEDQYTAMMKSTLQRMYGTDAQIEAAVVKAYGVPLPPEQLRIARTNLKTLIYHPKLPSWTAQIIRPLVEAGAT